MNTVAISKRLPFAAWLLACPLLLIVAVLVLPRFNQLYGTPAERYMLFLLLALPLTGVVGILRRNQFRLWFRLFLSAGYLAVCLVLAAFAMIFIGCSWAGACF